MLVYLTALIFFFVSYTANIVALLQSPSNMINTIRDVIDSDLQIGVENLPHVIVLVEKDTDPLVRELYRKKLSQKNITGEAYYNCSYGMSKVRKEFYGFHAEVASSARIISDTYTEAEKCDVKLITLFPYRYTGSAVPRKSPFRELLAQGFRWYDEVGFVKRTDRRFSYNLAKCGAGVGGRYNSIRISDIGSIYTMFIYGVILSLILLGLEKFHYYLSHHYRYNPPKRPRNFLKKNIKVKVFNSKSK